jgi:hypothetical protein
MIFSKKIDRKMFTDQCLKHRKTMQHLFNHQLIVAGSYAHHAKYTQPAAG